MPHKPTAPTDPWRAFADLVGHLAECDKSEALAGRVCVRCGKPDPTEIVGHTTYGPLRADARCAKQYVPYWMYGDWRALWTWREPELLDSFYARVSLRGTTVVYRCYDSDDTLLYIGQTQHPWTQPRRSHRVTYEVFPSRRAALQAERDAIRAENPTQNILRYEKTPIASEPIPWKQVRRAIYRRIQQQLAALELPDQTGDDIDEVLDELAASADQIAAAGGTVPILAAQHLLVNGRWPRPGVAARVQWIARPPFGRLLDAQEVKQATKALRKAHDKGLDRLIEAQVHDGEDSAAYQASYEAALTAGWTADELLKLRKPRFKNRVPS